MTAHNARQIEEMIVASRKLFRANVRHVGLMGLKASLTRDFSANPLAVRVWQNHLRHQRRIDGHGLFPERLIAVRESDDALFGLVIEGEWDALCGDWNYDLPLSLFVGGRLDLLIVRREDIDWIA